MRGFPCSNHFVGSALAVIVVISGTLLFGVSGRLDDKKKADVEDNIKLIDEIVNDFSLYFYFIEYLIGTRPAYGIATTATNREIEFPGFYFKLEQAYHSTLPAISGYWSENIYKSIRRREFLINTRDLQLLWETMKESQNHTTNCTNALAEAEMLTEMDHEQEKKVNDTIDACIDLVEPIGDQIRDYPREKLEEDIYRTCYRSVEAVLDSLYDAAFPDRIRGMDPWWNWNLFDQMYQETKEFDLQVHERLTTSFPAFIQKLGAEGKTEEATKMQAKLDEITARLSDAALPYKDIYFAGNEAAIEAARYTATNGIQECADNIEKLYFDDIGAGQSFADALDEWDHNDITIFKDALADASFFIYLFFLDDIWIQCFDVDPQRIPKMYDSNGVLIADGLWDWNPTTFPIHNMRLAWDLMGAVLEEIKCYMRETYYFDLRPEALKRTQRNLTEGALFSGFSRTIQAPCRIVNDLDLTGPYCTRENNEICSPATPLDPSQRTDSIHHGGLGLTKPRWIFQYDPVKYECGRGRRDYVMRMNFCRCGFRLDCGADLDANITCQLHHNDLLRGQCRGNVGYPCKTLPLAPGKISETCLSSYCNEQKNSCEDRPYIYRHTTGGSKREVKVNTGLVVALVGFSVFSCL